MAMKNSNNPNNNGDNELDQLFNQARQQQDNIAASAEIGVEARLHDRLNLQDNVELSSWFDALWKLCSAGGLVTACLAIWVIIQNTSASNISNLIFEQWIFGI